MERAFVFGAYNTWFDWALILTAKDVSPPEPKTNYVEIDGMSGSVDLSEALTGEPTYSDRKITASFCACEGSDAERESMLLAIVAAVHGRKLRIIEPDDPDHYFFGRVTVKKIQNKETYAELSIEAVCDPWRYEHNETVQSIPVNSTEPTAVRILNSGVRTLCPDITVSGEVTFTCNGVTSSATDGSYKITTFRLFRGENVIQVSGSGSLTLAYRMGVL